MAEKYSGDLLRIDPGTERADRIDVGAPVHGAGGRRRSPLGRLRRVRLHQPSRRHPPGGRGLPARGTSPASTPPASTTAQTYHAEPDRLRRPAGLPLRERRPAGARPRPGDLGARTHRRRQDLHLQPPARDQVLDRCRGPGLRLRARRAPRAAPDARTARLLRRHRRRPGVHRPPGVLRPEPGRRGGRRRGSGDVPPRGAGPAVPLQADPAGRPGAARDATGRAHLAAPGHRALPDHLLQPRTSGSRSPATPTSASGPPPAQPAGFLDAHHLGQGGRRPRRGGRRAAGPSGPRRAHAPGRADALRSGPLVDALRVAAPSRVHSSIMQGTDFGVLNSSMPPFDNVQARRAFNYAVDRSEGGQAPGWSLGGHRHLPADPTEHAVLPAVLPLHQRPTGRRLPRARPRQGARARERRPAPGA